MKNIKKIIISKPTKHNENADTHLFLLLFTKSQHEKKILKKTIFVSQVFKKGEAQRVLGILYHNIYRIQTINFQ